MKHPPITANERNSARPVPSDYIDHLREEFPALDLTDAEARAILEPLLEIMATHVRMGFGLEPVGKLIASFENSTSDSRILVNSKNTRKDANND